MLRLALETSVQENPFSDTTELQMLLLIFLMNIFPFKTIFVYSMKKL